MGIDWVYARPGWSVFVKWASFYVSAEIFFALNWVFIHRGGLHDFRRSTFCFLLNIFQIALYTEIIAILGHCRRQLLSFFQWAVSVLLVLIVLANVIGGIARRTRESLSSVPPSSNG